MRSTTRSNGLRRFAQLADFRAAAQPPVALSGMGQKNAAAVVFSIGLVMLNDDGTPQLDGNSNPIATYSQTDVENLARSFTGWPVSWAK